MFDYTNNFPIIKPQPEASKLRYLAYTQTPEFLNLMQGTGKVIDVNRISDPSAWGYASERQEEVTREEYLNANKVLMAEAGDMRGYMEDIAAYFGLNWFKDESQAAVVRGIYMGKEPLSPIKYRDSELTPEALETTQKNLQLLLEQEKGKTADPANLSPNQKRISEYIDKLAFATAKDKAKTQLGFSPSSFLNSLTQELVDKTDFITNRSGAEAADLSDIVKLRTEVDPTFKPSEWFDTFAADDFVKQGLLQYGISADLIAGAPNEDAAKFLIGRQLSRTDLQQRIAQYTPNWRDELNIFGTQLVNDPDLIPGLALEVGVTATGALIGSALGPAGTVGGALGARGLLSTFGLARGFARLKGVYDASRLVRAGVYTVETAAKLPLGMAPSYAKKLGLLGALGSTYALGAVGGGLTETFRQKQKIAYAAATMYADPDAQKEYDYEAIAFTSITSGAAGLALFGLAPLLINAGFGASLNRIKGINLAKYGETVLRDDFNKQWSLKGTMLGESLDSIKGIVKKEKAILDGPVDEVMTAKAELTGVKPTNDEVVSTAIERVDRAETKDIDSVEKATAVPEENASKRYDNESKEEYIARVAPNRLITDIVSFAKELSRSVPDALDNLVLSSYEWTKMTDKDKMRVLVDTKEWITKAKEVESKAVGGLSLDRAKVYDIMEKQRRGYIRNLGKNMTKDEYKAFMKELRGERIVELPEALVEARKAGATSKEKEAAASEAAAQLIERAKEIAKDRDKSVRRREEIPADLLASFDTATAEVSLTGKVSEETAADIRANVMGVEAPVRKKGIIRQAIDSAFVKKNLDPQRLEKIRAVAENPRRFIDLVDGNKEMATNFYRFVTQLKMKGLITADQKDLLLAATVHLNFDNKAFKIAYKIDALEKNYVGVFDRKNNTLTINSNWKGDSETRAQTVLHELGHAFVTHNAKGDLYLDMLRLYNMPTSAFAFTKGRIDSLLEMDFLNTYHLTNVEETFVQTFSEILFKETQIAVASLDPINTSILKTTLQSIAESLVLAADALNMSKYYKVANELIDEIVKINTGLDNNVSVVKFVDTFTQDILNAPSVQEANNRLKKLLGTEKYYISNNEWSLVTKMADSDPAFIVAYSILKTQGKSLTSQADYDYLVKAYGDYKEAQFNSILFRVSEALKDSNFYNRFFADKKPQPRTKEQRLAFLEAYYFDVIDSSEIGKVVPTPAKLPTYEDEIIGKIRSNQTGDTYGITYWLTSGEALRAELESRNVNTKEFDKLFILSNSILTMVQNHLTGLGLEETASYLTNIVYKRYLTSMTEGILNVELPNWTTKDIATSTLSEMLKGDLNLAVIFQILPTQIEPNLLKTLIEFSSKEGATPEESITELLTGLYNAIDKDIISYNSTTKKWEKTQPKAKTKKTPTKKTAAAKPAKLVEESEVEAIAENSSLVTIDNYMEHLQALMEKLSRDVAGRGKDKGFISQSSQNAITYIGRVLTGETPKLIAAIESGTINTVEKLEAAILKRGKNVAAVEGKEYRRVTETDPVTGKKTVRKVLVESTQTTEGFVKDGTPVRAVERIEEDGLVRENKIALIENINTILQYIPDFITDSERTLLDVFRLKPINEDAAVELNVDPSTISRRYNTLLKKLNSLFVEANITAEDLKNPTVLQEQLTAWSKKNKETAVAITKKKTTKNKVNKQEKEKTAKVDANEADKGKRIAELAAKTNKLKNTDPTPVPTPVTTTEPVMAKVTAEVTGNAPEEVLRPEKQADAIIEGDTSAVKEVVTFTPKKPLPIPFKNVEELMDKPRLVAAASRLGYDALTFNDGSVLPLKAEEVKVVGRTEINKPVGVETVVTVKVEKGVPVKKITPAPKKPKAAPEGTPVVVKKTGEPKKTKEVKPAKSDVVKTDENVRIERLVNEERDLARANGLDSSFLKKLLSAYWRVMKEVDKDINVPYTPTFMKAWTKFVVINKEIADANLKLFGEEGLVKFWKEVDRLRAIEQVKKTTVPGYKVRFDTTIFKEAAKSVDDKFIPFVTPGSLKLKEVKGEIVFTSKDTLTKAIVNENKLESPVPVPPKPKPDEKVELVELPDVDEVELSEIDSVLEEAITDSENNASLLLRQSNLIGVTFGGDNREAVSWWRELMNWMVNTTQTASATGLTIRSMQAPIRFISRMFDDTRAQTGHLAAAGKDAFRTAAQAKSDEKRIIARISKYQIRINKYLEDMPEKRKALMLSVYRKLTEGATLTEADVKAAGIADASLVKTLTKNSNELLEVVRQVNRTFLDLEAETGLVKTVDGMGNPVEADRWATVQFDHEQLSRLSPEQKKALVAKLVEARTKRKLDSKVLDVNTLIVLGWLDVAPAADAKGTRLFAGDRDYRPGLGLNTISKESLDKLRTGITYPTGTDPGNILANLANKGMPDEFFVLKENGVLNVYRMPRVIDDLAESDVIRYREAISGNIALYHPRWKEYLSNRNLIEAEMLEMIDFKTKSGAYSDFNSKTSSNIDRPLMRTGADEQTALAVPGLLPEEVLSFPEITELMRTNIAESYFYFLNGRLFELLFQRELDRLLGRKGITIINVFDYTYKHTEKQLKTLAKNQNWSPEVLNARIKEMADGISRLREEYAINADTLPTIPNKKLYTARAGLAMMKMKVAPGYILSTATEVMQELLKSNPIELPRNLIDSIRYVFGDIRAKKSKLLEEDIGDLPFVIDNFRSEYGDRLVGEISHGAFELDSKIKTKFIDSSTPLGAVDRGVRTLETGARVAESIGSLQAVTNFVRGMAMTRWQRRIWKHMSKGRIQKLLEVMEKPEMKVLMNKLLEASATDPVAERKLWKQFATEARKAGFGFEPQEAMIFFRYGLNTKEKINHLNYLIKNSGADSSGRVNINQMVNTYWMHKRNPKPGIDNRLLEEVLSSYSYMLEDLIIKTSSPEPTGLGRITNIDSKSSFGRLWYALTSWVRGYQDSVVLNYASKNTLNYLAGNLVLFGVLDTLTGLFREWVAGREHEDMVEEFTKNPASFAIRVARSSPIMGSANAVLEMFLSGLSALSGGSWRYYGSPMSSIGVGAANAAVKDVSTGLSDLAMQTQEFNGPAMTKAIGDITFANSLVNRSPVAVPVRFLEDMGALDQKGAVQKYLDLIQREPYPYAKSQRKAVAKGAQTLPITPTPRNIPLERAMFEEARKKQIRPQPLDVSTSAEGVSGILGDLLENQ